MAPTSKGPSRGILAAPSPLITQLPHTSGLRWTFSLRRGIQLHKGFGELKADDVVFSCHRVLDPKTCGPMRSIVDIVKDIKALDEYTVQMTIERPDKAAPTARRRSKNTALLSLQDVPGPQPACQTELSGGGGAQLVLYLDCGHGHPGVGERRGSQHGQR